VTKYLKMIRLKNTRRLGEFEKMSVRNAIQKWRERKDRTKEARTRVKNLRALYKKMQLRAYFLALKTSSQASSALVKSLSRLANIQNKHGLLSGFDAISSFSRAKAFVHSQRKANSVFATCSALQVLINKKRHQYFIDFRLRCMRKSEQDMHKALTILHAVSNRKRHMFNKWRTNADLMTLAKEMEEEGPIREQVFEHKMNFMNCVDFLTAEGYDNEDIKEALVDGVAKQNYLIEKGVARFKHYNENKYVVPKMFDQWKKFTILRRFFKNQLKFATMKSDFATSDIS
jgi:hypothetical protein